MVRAFLLAAGRGLRFRPVTERIPKPLFPYLNVPLIRSHLRRLRQQGILEAAINLHHLGGEIESHLRDLQPDLPSLVFFHEPEILGTAGALRNAADWLSGEDFFVINADTAIEPDLGGLGVRHRESGRPVSLLVTSNLEPDRYTPLQAEGDRIQAFGRHGPRPLLYTGICVMSPRLLARIPPGEASLVADLWQPLLSEAREEIGWVLHQGRFSDLGRPSDFLRASLEALDHGGPFPARSGAFDPHTRVLSAFPADHFTAFSSVIGRASTGRGARLERSVVWGGAQIGEGAKLSNCLLAAGRVAPRAVHENALLWSGTEGEAHAYPL